MTDFDLVIRNARIATAADVFECDIGVNDGRIATLARGYAVVRAGGEAVRTAEAVSAGDRLEIELAVGALGARVEEVRS